MAIDPSIITNATLQQQAQQNEIGNKLAGLTGALGQLVLGRKAQQMSQLATPQEQQAFANNSIFSPYLNRVLKANQLTAQKNAIDLLKAQAEIGKTNSEAFKNNQQGGGYKLDNAGKLMSSANQALMVAAQTGDPLAAKLALNNAYKAGAIDDATFNQFNGQIDIIGNDPAKLKQYAQSIVFAQSKDPDKYLFTTADNQLDNQTAIANNIRTTDASRYATDTAASTADKNREQQSQQFSREQQLQEWLAKNKPIDTQVGNDGYLYAIYPGGKGVRISDQKGNPIQPQSKRAGKPQISDQALKSVNEINTNLSTATQSAQKINSLISDVQSGKLNLSAANQLGAKAKNLVGLSDENSRGVENFQTALNQAVNDVLMMAKGTQTEGDAQRAAQVIAANPPRDNAAALQVLQRLAAVQQNTISALNQNMNSIYDNYGVSRPQPKTPQAVQSNADKAKLNNILFGR
ncbi:hypothetical protein IG607_09265 [Acinetobacter nosocomialis]|uniref:hypothetical protein n=1 Tax=Acinetobacter nosocomialis TaxID=106654 RepID=UPI001785830B|nr:hypothetical protein [Acinetobacter nosocomialis]MBD8351749.1 hypothetical protein [Acinetobacter nosocomialis]